MYLLISTASAADSDCPLPDLLSGVPSYDNRQSELPLSPACIPSEQPSGTCTFAFQEGSVTYNGNSSGSIAFYNVTDAYCINTTMERMCDAGMWINDVILEEGVISCVYMTVRVHVHAL